MPRKKRRRGGDVRRIAAATARAAEKQRASWWHDDKPHQGVNAFLTAKPKPAPTKAVPKPQTPRKFWRDYVHLVTPKVRQRSLLTGQRTHTREVLGKRGGPLGERRRRAAQAALPEELRRAICGDRKKRKEVMHAQGKKALAKGASAPRQLTWRSFIKC